MDPQRGSRPQEDTTPEERPAKRRHRSAVACQRCKTRKQRCDNEFPSCSNCLCSGEPCAYGVNQIYPAEYVRSLESHIAQLERSMASADPKVALDHLASVRGRARRQPSREPADPLGGAPARDLERGLEVGVGFVALSPNSFLGTSSGFPLAKLVKSAIDPTSRHVPRLGTPGRRTSTSGVPRSLSEGVTLHQEGNSSVSSVDMPSDEVAERLIAAYFSKVHPKHPFLSRKRIYTLSRIRATLAPAHQARSSEGRADYLGYAILHLIYAIGARYLQLVNDHNCAPSPEAHYTAALTDVDAISDVRSIENLEAMLLLSIYQLRSPTGPGIWWMIGTTMRHCVDSGLHRKSNTSSSLFDQRRKRIFWTAYMLERSVARTVGRPYSVADREIDAALPADIDDSFETDEEVTAAIAQSLANPSRVTSLSAAIHIIKVQQIESRISHTVCRVDKPIGSVSAHKIAKLRDALEEWKANIPKCQDTESEDKAPYSTTDYHMIQYHKALLLLFLPLLPTFTLSHPEFRQVAYSAGQICQLYKRLHDNQSYISFSLLALHANFVAGLVLAYCFCLDPALFDTRFSSDIRACSTMLYTISERWPAARKVRSAFESLVAATIEGQHDGTSREARHPGEGNGRGNRPLQLEVEFLVSQSDGRASSGGRPSDRVWDSFETVLEDYQINAETWMQDSIFQAMDFFPAEGWTTGWEMG